MTNDTKPKLRKHGGLWALREAFLGYSATRIRWDPGLYLARHSDRLFVFRDGTPLYEYDLRVSDIKGHDWVDPSALRDFRAALSTPVITEAEE